jgi:hypothetical protein
MSQRKPAGIVEAKRFSGTSKYIEVRIYSANKQGKGDRTELLDAKQAKKLAYALLSEAEDISN